MEAGKDPAFGDYELPPDLEARFQRSSGDEEEVAAARVSPEAKELAIAPVPGWESQEDYDADAVRKRLLEFHLYGRRAEGGQQPSGRLVPALLHAYRDATRVRSAYPLCLTGDELVAVPLRDIFDDAIERAAESAADAERLRYHAMELESAVRHGFDGSLSKALGGAKKLLVKGSPKENRDKLAEDLDLLIETIERDGTLQDLDAETPTALFERAARSQWLKNASELRDEINDLARALGDVLSAGFSGSEDANSPEHLEKSSGLDREGEVDFDAMAVLLGESHLTRDMPATRRQRLENAVATMKRMAPLFDPEAQAGDLPFELSPLTNDCVAAVERYRAQVGEMVELFKQIQVARLEAENRYRESVHDDFFAGFDVTHLDTDELSLVPPVLLVLDAGFFAHADESKLLEILSARTPVKILAVVDDLLSRDDLDANTSPVMGWHARLGAIAMSLGHVFVSQTPISHPAVLIDALRAGVDYAGPALFSVHQPGAEIAAVSPYFAAAAAAECRAFPVFTFDPAKGETWLERMDIGHNPSVESAWTEDQFEFRTEAGEADSETLAFTAGDLLACDPRLADHYWAVEPAMWHKDMTPLENYDGDIGTAIPYVTMVDNDGKVWRLVVTETISRANVFVRSHWRSVQELGGVNNSHAADALARERRRLEKEKAREVEDIEKKYAADLDRDLGALTEEIIGRIAGQLISDAANASFVPAAPAARPAKPAAAPAPGEAPPAEEALPEAEPEEDEDDGLSLGEPYIDTPLCTSCNDCMKFNAQVFAYNENKQAYIKDASAGTFEELVKAAEACPVKIIHPGKPLNPNEPNLDALIERAAPFN